MNIRFTDENWRRFFTHKKDTTWRSTPRKKEGIYERVTGSLYKPKKTGERVYLKLTGSKPFAALSEADARHDGFKDLKEFQDELFRLNPEIKATTILYCHQAHVVKSDAPTPPALPMSERKFQPKMSAGQ